jgi:hypothetical protein
VIRFCGRQTKGAYGRVGRIPPTPAFGIWMRRHKSQHHGGRGRDAGGSTSRRP